MSSINTNVSVPHLDYDQMLDQIKSLKSTDILCIKDGKLSAWQPGQGGAKAPNTKEVLDAVFKSVTAKIDGSGGDYEKYRSHLIGSFDKAQRAVTSKENKFLVEDLNDFLSGFKDLNTKPAANAKKTAPVKTETKTEEKAKTEETKGVGSIPKPGETLTMTRAELEKNLDSWIKAGYRVTVEIAGKGSYKLAGKASENEKPHMYDAFFSSSDGTVINERRSFELPDSSYAVSQSAAKSEAKPEIKVRQRPVEMQTAKSNTCFLWCFSNSRGVAKNKQVYAQNEEFFKQAIPGKVRVFGPNGPEDFDVKTLEDEVGNLGEKGKAFLAKLKGLKPGFEKNLVLYCYAKNANGYRDEFDARGGFPVGESNCVAPLLGLEPKENHRIKFGTIDDGKTFKHVATGGNVQPNDVLAKIFDCMEKDELVTLNLDGAHFVSVKSVDVKQNTITYLDSLDGKEKTETLEQLAAAYSTHGKERVLTFSTFEPRRGDKIVDNLNDVLEFVQELADPKAKQPKSRLMKELLGKCNGDLKNCKDQISCMRIKAFSSYVRFIQKDKAKIISAFRTNEDLKFTVQTPLTGNKDDSDVQFLSSIVSYLSAFEQVNQHLQLPPVPGQQSQQAGGT